MLILLPFHGQSSTEDVEAVFADPAVLASTGKYPMGQNPNMFDPDFFQKFAAPLRFQEISLDVWGGSSEVWRTSGEPLDCT